MAKPSVLTPQAEDFPRWYQDVVAKAELADNGPVRGTMVILPYGYAIWERMQAEVDARIKEAGAENCYFPLFIPESYLHREAEHVEGFSPELAVVTHAGGKELEEPIVVRPTSETIIDEYMAKWIQTYRDLPLLWNQWANVVRWELRPRLFLRTSEFLWQEGHTAHATYEDAAGLRRADPARGLRATSWSRCWPSRSSRAARRPRALPRRHQHPGLRGHDARRQGPADGHQPRAGSELRPGLRDPVPRRRRAASSCAGQTSWGVSTRMVGGLIMCHGDDAGLRVPPRLAPTQVVVVLVKADDDAGAVAAGSWPPSCKAPGVRVELDDRVDAELRPALRRLGAEGRAGAPRGRPARPGRGRGHRWCAATSARRRPIAGGRRGP